MVAPAGCGGGSHNASPTSPTPATAGAPATTLDGVYFGTATGPPLNVTNFILTATVAGNVITGAVREAEGSSQVPLSGTASPTGDVTMDASDPCGARYTFNGTVALEGSSGARMTGTWSQSAGQNCAAASGTFTIVRGGSVTSSATFPSGTWAGTLSRPGGDSLAAIWIATRTPAVIASTSGSFDGPLMLTYKGVTVMARLSGNLGGSNTAVMGGYRFSFSLAMEPTSGSAVPNCGISSTESGNTQNLRDNSTTITTEVFTIRYHNCNGFTTPVSAPPSLTDAGESTRLILTKQ